MSNASSRAMVTAFLHLAFIPPMAGDVAIQCFLFSFNICELFAAAAKTLPAFPEPDWPSLHSVKIPERFVAQICLLALSPMSALLRRRVLRLTLDPHQTTQVKWAPRRIARALSGRANDATGPEEILSLRFNVTVMVLVPETRRKLS